MQPHDRLQDAVRDIEAGSKGQLWKTIHSLAGDSAREICKECGISEAMTSREESKQVEKLFRFCIWEWGEKSRLTTVVGLLGSEKARIAELTVQAAWMLIGYWH